MLSRLRDRFDDPLFIRNQRGITPTKRAKELSLPIKQLLNDAKLMMQPAVFEPALSQAVFHIAASDYAIKTVILPLIQLLRAQALHIRIAVLDVEPDQIYAQLETGALDFALVTPEQTHENLYSEHLFEEYYICAVHQQHDFAQRQQLTLADYCTQPYVLVSQQGDAFQGIVDQLLATHGLQREVVLSVHSFLVLSELLASTDLFAIMPSRLIPKNAELKVLDMPLAIPTFHKCLVWHAHTHHHAPHQWLRQLIGSIYHDLAK